MDKCLAHYKQEIERLIEANRKAEHVHLADLLEVIDDKAGALKKQLAALHNQINEEIVELKEKLTALESGQLADHLSAALEAQLEGASPAQRAKVTRKLRALARRRQAGR